MLKDFEDEQRSVVTGLWDVVRILNGLDREVGRPFVATVLEIGERFCRARGSFGRVISREDRQMLLLLTALLDIEASGSQPSARDAIA